MCTAITYKTRDFYFGRTMDYEFSYGDKIVVTPRDYPFSFRYAAPMRRHHAIIGMAHVENDYPLYYEAVNETGLCMAGLNFPENAFYFPPKEGAANYASFELIPLLLGSCSTVEEAVAHLRDIRIVDTAFSPELPPAPLHWLLSDKNSSVTVESMECGLQIHENPVGVLTNNPPFENQLFQLNNYMSLSTCQPQNSFCKSLPLKVYSRGMGAIGLPGDLSSSSRFVRAAFVRANSVAGEDENESVSQFFHILGSVEQQRGCCRLTDGQCEITIYTCCVNADRGIYYYTSYGNSQITAVDMHRENLDSCRLIGYPRLDAQQIKRQN